MADQVKDVLVYSRTGGKYYVPENKVWDTGPDGKPLWSIQPPTKANGSTHYGTTSVNAKTGPAAPVPGWAQTEKGPMMVAPTGGLEQAPVPSAAKDMEAKGYKRAITPGVAAATGAYQGATLGATSRFAPEWSDYYRQVQREYPTLAGLSEIAGGGLTARFLPGGTTTKLAAPSAVRSVLGPAAKLTAQQAALAGFAASNAAPEGQRLKAAGNAALGSLALFPVNAALGPITTRTPAGSAATVENTAPLSLVSPSTYTNPESFQLRASLARISSLRGTPTDAADIAAQYANGSLNPVQGIANFGRKLNEARSPVTGRALFGAEDAGGLVAKAAGAKNVHAQTIKAAEDASQAAGNLPSRSVFDRIRNQGVSVLGNNPDEATARTTPFLAAVDAIEGKAAPTTVTPPQNQPFNVQRTSMNALANEFGPVPPMPLQNTVPTKVQPQFMPFDDAKKGVVWLREGANRRGGFFADQTDPNRSLVGRQLGVSSAMLNDEIEGQVGKTVGPSGLANYQGAKDQFGLLSRVEDMANPMRSATAAPNSLSSILEGAAAEQTGAAMGLGLPGIIALRAAGRMMGRQGNVNPTRASRLARLAEGTETPLFSPTSPVNGMPVSVPWRAAGLGVRGVANAPGRAGAGFAASGGTDVGDIYADPRQDPIGLRAAIARRLMTTEFFGK